MEDKVKELFGEDINMLSKMLLGIILCIFVWFLVGIWDIVEWVYNSGFVSKLEGVQLDRLGSNFGISWELVVEVVIILFFIGEFGFVIEE